MSAYIDTSALAKWYLNEPLSDEFEAYVRSIRSRSISRLTVVEFRCLIARRRRAGEIDRTTQTRVLETFESDLSGGHLGVHSVSDQRFADALALIDRLNRLPLRVLDALHLAVAINLDVEEIATADRVMASAARTLGMRAIRFF